MSLKKRSRSKGLSRVGLHVMVSPEMNETLEGILDQMENNGSKGFTMSDLIREGLGLAIKAHGSPRVEPEEPKASVSVSQEPQDDQVQGLACDGKYFYEGKDRQCKMWENGHCLHSRQPLGCPKLSKYEVEARMGKSRAVKGAKTEGGEEEGDIS